MCLTSSLWLHISGALSSSYKDARPFGLIVPSLHFYLTLILSIKILSLKIITLWFGGSTYECLFVWGLGTVFFFDCAPDQELNPGHSSASAES